METEGDWKKMIGSPQRQGQIGRACGDGRGPFDFCIKAGPCVLKGLDTCVRRAGILCMGTTLQQGNLASLSTLKHNRTQATVRVQLVMTHAPQGLTSPILSNTKFHSKTYPQ